jgi:hypothetical protein
MSNSELLGGGSRDSLVGGNLVLNGHGTSKSSTVNSVSLGVEAGRFNQDVSGIAIGAFAGASGQQAGAIAIGANCAILNQGVSSIALGQRCTDVSNNCIVMNATGLDMSGNAFASGCYIKPVRTVARTGLRMLCYNPSTGEITFDTVNQ